MTSLRSMRLDAVSTVLLLSVVVLVCAVCCVAAEEKPANPAPPVDIPPLEISFGPNGLSIHAVGVQADEFFTKLAQTAGIGVIIDDTVGKRDGDKYTCRKITVHLTDKKLSDIVQYICTAYGLSHSLQNGVLMISEGIRRTHLLI